MWWTAYDGTKNRIYYAESTNGWDWVNYKLVMETPNQAKGACVIKDGSIYRIWWSEHDGTGFRIMYSTSNDGTAWVDHKLCFGYGIISPDTDKHTTDPHVIKDGSTYRMYCNAVDTVYTLRIYHSEIVDNYAASSTYESPIIDLGSSYQGDLIAMHSDIPPGCSLTLQGRSGSEAKVYGTGIDGVTPKYTNPEHPEKVTGTLFWRAAPYNTLQWKDDSQPTPTYGDAVTIDTTTTKSYKIHDGSQETNFIEVEVAGLYLPAYDTTGTYISSEWTEFSPYPAKSLENLGNNKMLFINRTNTDARLTLAEQSNRFWQYRIEGTTPGSTTWVVRDVILLPRPTNWSNLQVLDTSVETQTEIQNCPRNRYWQWLLLGASNGTETWSFSSFSMRANYFAVDLKPTNFGGYPLYTIGCTNLKRIEINAGVEKIYSIAHSTAEEDLTQINTVERFDGEAAFPGVDLGTE